MILGAAEPDRMLWACWAAKETAFKIFRQSGVQTPFSPPAFEVSIDGRPRAGICPFATGVVAGRGGSVFVRIHASPEYIHCVGTDGCAGRLDAVVWGIERMEEGIDESDGARRAAESGIAGHMRIPEDRVEIRREKIAGCLHPPRVYISGREADASVSLSHDRPFAAYAFLPGS
jgi:hypothetical protein